MLELRSSALFMIRIIYQKNVVIYSKKFFTSDVVFSYELHLLISQIKSILKVYEINCLSRFLYSMGGHCEGFARLLC